MESVRITVQVPIAVVSLISTHLCVSPQPPFLIILWFHVYHTLLVQMLVHISGQPHYLTCESDDTGLLSQLHDWW